MEIEGVYWVQFAAFTGMWGNGIMVLDQGRAAGGDPGFTYVGRYQVENGIFKAELAITRYAEGGFAPLPLGETIGLTFTGPVKEGAEPTIAASGLVPGSTDLTVTATMKRVGKLG
jgi:hypothetical protein